MKKKSFISFIIILLTLITPTLLISLSTIKAIEWSEKDKRLNIFTSGNNAPSCNVTEQEDEIALYINLVGTALGEALIGLPDVWGFNLDFIEQNRSSGTLLKISSLLHFNYRVERLSGDVGYSAVSISLWRGDDDISQYNGDKRMEGIFVYEEPDMTSKLVANIEKPEKIIIREMVGEWYRIEQIDGDFSGWAKMEHITIDNDDEMKLRNRIVKDTRAFLGVEYLAGGTDSGGFDCSGLVYRVYTDLGIEVPRGSISQYNTGKKLSYESARPGDLVFFYISEIDVLHVGIYTGGGLFINSNSYYDKVMEEELSDKYWSDRFYGFASYL